MATSASDVLILGGSTVVALDNSAPAVSSETGSEFTILTQALSPQGRGGDVEFRRLYLTVTSNGGFSLTITPVLDGVDVEESEYVISGSGGSSTNPKRTTFMIPLSRRAYRNGVALPGRFGVRGSSLQVRIAGSFANQTATWHLDSVEVIFKTAHSARSAS